MFILFLGHKGILDPRLREDDELKANLAPHSSPLMAQN